ncbi:di-heme oxidoredictase family protein [Vogesella sp. AC12]|uniref:di-heme oxidoreductase family protein n=1 Tax=Vogesella sp. AC12 TaxID=2950550 RepID=UPI00210DBEFB|nr:di-heme oxidoredictase family protein [Vogesella sp. AC12]MCQ4143081.1 thiol oxidoreductase [Vogesella sp. AC12]
MTKLFLRPASWLAAGLILGGLVGFTSLPELAPYHDGDEKLGGDTTVYETGRNAFSLSAANMASERQTRFFVGNSFFKKAWVEAPSSTTARDGLGPHFIARSCGACHALDGRGAPPQFDKQLQAEQPMALLFRLSVPGASDPQPEPNYGGQFNNDAIPGVKPEGKVQIIYQPQTGSFPDGEPFELLQPQYRFTELGYGPLHPQLQVSPRIAPQMIGLGLLEAIREQDILANARAQAAANLGVSGRANYVPDAYAGKTLIGRFGWKANVATIAHQSAGAFNGDIGITSRHFAQEECLPAQRDCRQAARGGKPEIPADKLDAVIFYSRTLAVPAQREADSAEVRRGKWLFSQAQCSSCHVASYTTGPLRGLPEVSGQKISPYTDLLLHNMGPGLADGRPDGLANGQEWKTPPLWGIGLFADVNGHTRYLHDGRARNLSEAILWHGGEAEAAKQRFMAFNKTDRAALLRFLESL